MYSTRSMQPILYNAKRLRAFATVMENSEKEKYTINTPSDVWRISIGERPVFITEKTYKLIKYNKEYREQMSKAKECRKTTRSTELSTESFRSAWGLLADVAVRESETRDTTTELSKVVETAEEGLKKRQKETMEGIAELNRVVETAEESLKQRKIEKMRELAESIMPDGILPGNSILPLRKREKLRKTGVLSTFGPIDGAAAERHNRSEVDK